MPAPAVTPALLAYDNTVVFRTFVARPNLGGSNLSNGATRLACIAGWVGGGRRSLADEAVYSAKSVGCCLSGVSTSLLNGNA